MFQKRCHLLFCTHFNGSICHQLIQQGSIGLIIELYMPNKEISYKYLHKIDRFKVEIVHILVIITAVTQKNGSCKKS